MTKYHGKEQPLTIVQGGTKYVAAPNSTTHVNETQTTTNM